MWPAELRRAIGTEGVWQARRWWQYHHNWSQTLISRLDSSPRPDVCSPKQDFLIPQAWLLSHYYYNYYSITFWVKDPSDDVIRTSSTIDINLRISVKTVGPTSLSHYALLAFSLNIYLVCKSLLFLNLKNKISLFEWNGKLVYSRLHQDLTILFLCLMRC